MVDESIQTKKVTRRKTTKQAVTESEQVFPTTAKSLSPITEAFADLVNKITQHQLDFERLQKQIGEVKQTWDKEQKDHEIEVAERNRQEEIQRQREKEMYLYEIARERKKAEDEFADKKAAWEKELRDQREAIEKDRAELGELRKLAEDFQSEKEKVVKEAEVILEGELAGKFMTDKKLREQEFKSEKEILNLKIGSLTSENTRLTNEIASLKQKLDEATRQLKEIAVKVIESRGNLVQVSPAEE